jgi:uncharacterized C2H2 Zn-finger protein
MSATKGTKVTLKSLQAEVNIFKEELKVTKDELNDVKKELKEVKDEIKLLKEEGSMKNPEMISRKKRSSESELKCKICDNAFGSRKSLKMHVVANHVQKIKCKSCEEIFAKNSDLELHAKRNHESIEQFGCEQCDKTFVLKWRLRKHQEIHARHFLKKCHYFNNRKYCPFEDIGCMFEHTLSGPCKYGKKCTKPLCSFEHDLDENEKSFEGQVEKLRETFETLTDDEQSVKIVHPSENEVEYSEDDDDDEFYPCNSCDAVFLDKEDMSEHIVTCG